MKCLHCGYEKHALHLEFRSRRGSWIWSEANKFSSDWDWAPVLSEWLRIVSTTEEYRVVWGEVKLNRLVVEGLLEMLENSSGEGCDCT